MEASLTCSSNRHTLQQAASGSQVQEALMLPAEIILFLKKEGKQRENAWLKHCFVTCPFSLSLSGSLLSKTHWQSSVPKRKTQSTKTERHIFHSYLQISIHPECFGARCGVFLKHQL